MSSSTYTTSPIKDEHQPRNILYDIDIDSGAFTAANFEESYPPEDYHWDVNGRRSSSGNYSTAKTTKGYHRSPQSPTDNYENTHYEGGQYSDSADSRDAQTEQGTQYITRRSHSACAEGVEETIGATGALHGRHRGAVYGNEQARSLAAAQELVEELFPELENPYPESVRRPSFQYGAGQAYMSPGPQQFRGLDPTLHAGSASPYRTAGATSGERSPPGSRPRSDFAAVSPESMQFPHPAHYPDTYANQNISICPEENFEFLGDSEGYDSETDEEGDDDDCSMIMMDIDQSGSPGHYYGESSASPERDIEMLGRINYNTDLNHSSSSSYAGRKEMRSLGRRSNTSTGPRRIRKAMPPTAPYNSNDAQAKAEHNDAMLVHLRRQGISYKSIKQRLDLDEAESTLRGRFRTLTKPKSERLASRRGQSPILNFCSKSSTLPSRRSNGNKYPTTSSTVEVVTDSDPAPARNSTLHWSMTGAQHR
ncbi:Similar to hypothetical protein SMAC_09386 [Sordaria macrospora k-hell]; acc. no. XP_003343920 [Pyronema omphalodes CBS 100304]|uniref:Uncharacterized protein n=1 Tax=Pyronema omphalodes (strain CBS 100304) TaxID=1076935 RepID=U4L282_PYROM|nr:Similar to hypothetical protein SMAC_09386 [Sordaria macrospora k-hell]; acc. no. XP_003343920 [Pyronema omphalodes CBS 100304]